MYCYGDNEKSNISGTVYSYIYYTLIYTVYINYVTRKLIQYSLLTDTFVSTESDTLNILLRRVRGVQVFFIDPFLAYLLTVLAWLFAGRFK